MKISARTTALAVALGLVAVLVTALPAFAAADTVTGFTPVCGVVGTPVTITGTGFTLGGNVATAVTFPGSVDQSTLTGVSDTQLTANVPATSSGTAQLVVIDADGNGTSAASFTVAAAAAATVASFSPTSGAVGASVVITGTNFCGATAVKFNTTSATYTVNSATSITATVPAGATTGAVHVTTPSGTADSATSFTVVGVPTITSFSPVSGPVGTTVTITGTNLTGVTAVKFNLTPAVTIGTSTATSVTAKVPTGATTGKITVTNPGGTATSVTDFTVTTVTKHHRSVTLRLTHSLIASGTVHVSDGFNACRSHVTVKIQRLKNGSWRTVGTDQTSATGKYKKALEDRSGKYRALAKKVVLNGGSDICMPDTSPTVNHHHA